MSHLGILLRCRVCVYRFGWGLRLCISNQLQSEAMLLVHEAHRELRATFPGNTHSWQGAQATPQVIAHSDSEQRSGLTGCARNSAEGRKARS